MKNFVLISLLMAAFISTISAQQPTENVLHFPWKAQWIAPQNVHLKTFGVFHFRKNFELETLPKTFIVNISGDNRYRVLVNGNYIGAGPARSDLMHWNFETYDLAPYLQKGKNTIAAVVWNFAEDMPWAQISNKTGFILQGNTAAEDVVNTDKTWKVSQNKAYKALPVDGSKLWSFIVVGCGEDIDASLYPYDWEKTSFNDETWPNALTLERGYPTGTSSGAGWYLVPRSIPQQEEIYQPLKAIRRVEGMANISDDFLKKTGSTTIPSNSKVTILLDQGFETVAYPELSVSDGGGASIQLTYAEALMDEKRQKGNRNEIEGRKIFGNQDIFRPDGSANRIFKPLWFRTYRYIELEIITKDKPLIINDFHGLKTGYPFQENASFSSSQDKSLKEIWNIGWQTARLCGGETYFDCPYYEQLQYTGDTRIQSLISLYVSGDDRLMRKALIDYDNSMISEGLTQSRYPSNIVQIIPTFSLFWVSMNYDYWMHRKDDQLIKTMLPNIEKVLAWYERKLDPKKNILGPINWWPFVDWAKPWQWDATADIGGIPAGATSGNSSIISFQYAYTLRQAADLFEAYGEADKAKKYRKMADLIAKATFNQCFDATKGEVSDTPDKKIFSQHASVFALLADAVPKTQETVLMNKILTDTSLIQTTFYFKFYLTQALKKVGMADKYTETLEPWRDMIKMGLTTFAEKEEPVRSDCHAWSASPNYDFLATICGIMPAASGFEKVLIQPALGILNDAEGSMPHPKGQIKVNLKRRGKTGINAEITLPDKLTGTFVWNKKKVLLKGGKQLIEL